MNMDKQQSSQHQQQQMNGNMEFECKDCDKKFKYYCYFKRHMDACHSQCPKYVCQTCNKSYKWEASFRQHLRSHHQSAGANGAGGPNQPGGEDQAVAAAALAAANSNGVIAEDENETAPPDMEDEESEETAEEEEEPETAPESANDKQPAIFSHAINERDNDAAGTLASIAESINAAVLCGNRDSA